MDTTIIYIFDRFDIIIRVCLSPPPSVCVVCVVCNLLQCLQSVNLLAAIVVSASSADFSVNCMIGLIEQVGDQIWDVTRENFLKGLLGQRQCRTRPQEAVLVKSSKQYHIAEWFRRSYEQMQWTQQRKRRGKNC